MNALLLVFNVKANSFLKTTFDFRPQSLLKNVSSAIIFGGVAICVFLLARGVTAYLLQQAHIGQFLYHRFLSMLMYILFIMVNLGNIIVCYATVYKSEEVSFLMGLPIPHEKVFLIKFVDNFFYSSSTLTLLGVSWLLGYGSLFAMPWTFYFFTIFAVLLPFMLIAGVTAVIILMGLIKIASRIGMRWLLATIVGVYLSAVYVYFRVTSPVQLVQEVMRHYPDVNEYFGYLDAPLIRFLPSYWVSEFLYWSTQGDSIRAFPHFLMLMTTLAALIVLARFLARRYYYKSWASSLEARTVPGGRMSFLRPKFLDFGKEGLFAPQTDALVKRDFWLFFREPSQWLHLLLMLFLLLIFLLSMETMDIKLGQPILRVMSFVVVFLFNGFLIASLSLRFVFPAVSLEGMPFWAVRSAPVPLRRLYWYKFGFLFGVTFVLAELLAIPSTALLRENPFLVALFAICMGFVALALTSVNLGAGAYFASYREKNPIRIASSQGASLTFLLAMIYLAVVAGVLVLPLNIYFERELLQGVPTASLITAPAIIVGLLSLVLSVVSISVGMKSLARDF